MEMQHIFNAVVALAAFLGGWILNNITRAIERLDADVRAMPHDYVGKEDYRRDIDELKDICKRIFERLDQQADRRVRSADYAEK
jgi:hypothetical protein